MKCAIAGLLFITTATAIQAQEFRLPKKAAQRYAQIIVGQTGTPYSGQITTNVDVLKACATRGEGGGAMVVPDKKLTKKALAQAGKEIVPIGQLWLRKWLPVVNGKTAPKASLRFITVNIDDKDRPMPLLLLGVRQNTKKQLELVVYANAEKPLQVVTLKKVEFIQELPLELDWRRGEKQADPLTLTILGRYQAVLMITRQ